jgi:predicted nucleotidyltransferase
MIFAPTAMWMCWSRLRVGLFDLVRMEDELKNLFGRDVDLVERAAIEKSENYIRRKSILSNTQVVYAAG